MMGTMLKRIYNTAVKNIPMWALRTMKHRLPMTIGRLSANRRLMMNRRGKKL
jgi:hypothetical protein